ncbi:hypothetical protein EZS27_022239 [termite gut metagenome]|uniref:Uncharacterized protein n=1 Tax=termite gut metagenome TaxID=433724 RepID=A0A5J4R5D2_9ZZZZ
MTEKGDPYERQKRRHERKEIKTIPSIYVISNYHTYHEFPPSDASNLSVIDRDQMMFQLKLPGWDNREKTDMYENWILPKLKEVGSNVEYVPKDLENTNGTWTWSKGTSTVANIIGASVTVERTAGGLWNNYIQAWEPGGDYFTGEKFYKPLALHNLEGVTPTTWWSSRRPEIFREVQKIWGKDSQSLHCHCHCHRHCHRQYFQR